MGIGLPFTRLPAAIVMTGMGFTPTLAWNMGGGMGHTERWKAQRLMRVLRMLRLGFADTAIHANELVDHNLHNFGPEATAFMVCP